MAGFWIPMRIDLEQDPSVIAMADALGMDEYAIVGRLHCIWSWANENLTDGHAHGVTQKWIDRRLQTPGFAEAMTKAGWLAVEDGHVVFPKFSVWNDKSAKIRLNSTKRKQRQREKQEDGGDDLSHSQRDISVTQPGTTAQHSTNINTPAPASPGGPDVLKSKPRKPKAETNPNHTPAIEHFTARWKAWFKGDYPFQPKDAKAIERILKAIGNDLDKFKRIVERYFANTEKFFAGHCLTKLDNAIATFIAEPMQQWYDPTPGGK